ncbi:MAG: DNA primase [Tepidisphaeraceae bacterium]
MLLTTAPTPKTAGPTTFTDRVARMTQGNSPISMNGIDGKTLVLQAVDLVQLIGQTVALKKRGRSYIGLCPFHNEKSPSFNVHPDKGFFHCFGCKASGNAIDFVIKRDGLTFPDALRQLAEQYNVELPRSGFNRESAGVKQMLLDACSAAAAYFEQNLRHPQLGQAARAYLAERGFNDETIRNFRLGFAPDGWDGLLRSPVMKKFRPEQLVQAGLLKSRDNERGGGVYDTFRNRLMFPIRDEAGRIIAFGGRVMPGSDAPAKYLNSPETPLFSKSRVAYGLDLGRPRIVETKTVAIVEGYTDVVMAHQYGASNVVSVLGTALTEQHVNLLRRFASRIVLLFDGDAAGDLAVERALELFLTQPIDIAIATLPDGVDPDEYLLQHGQAGFDALLQGAEDALSFQWRQLFRKLAANENDLTGRAKAVESYLERLAKARAGGPVDPIRWGAILARVAKFTDIPADELNRRFKAPRPPRFAPVQPAQPENLKKSSSPAPRPVTALLQAERQILGALLHLPNQWFNVQQVLDAEQFTDETLRPLAVWYWDYQRHEGQPALAELAGLIEDPALKSLAIELAAEVEVMNNPADTLSGALAFLEQEKLRQRDRKLVSELRRSNDKRQDADSEIDALRLLTQAGQARSGVRVS